MTTRPNLFDCATKELSQDAMICWLLKWAAKEYREIDPQLAEVGVKFVRALLSKHSDRLAQVEVDTVEVAKQHKWIDVLAKINDTHVLLIEDKTRGGDRGGQLERYYKEVRKQHLPENIYPIYLKTGNFPLSERCWIEQERPHERASYRYRVFDRCDFLRVLEEGPNAILADFHDRLLCLEDRTNNYRSWTKDSSRGCWESWQGLLMCLEQKFKPVEGWAGWGKVSNKSGGFLGLWWGWDAHRYYMQLQVEPHCPSKRNLCFKVGDVHAAEHVPENVWKDFHGRIMEAGHDRVRRPPRIRPGKTMTVAMWGQNSESWLAFDANGKLDFEKTVSNLREAEGVLKEAVGLSP